jgi:hypothetical protein
MKIDLGALFGQPEPKKPKAKKAEFESVDVFYARPPVGKLLPCSYPTGRHNRPLHPVCGAFGPLKMRCTRGQGHPKNHHSTDAFGRCRGEWA